MYHGAELIRGFIPRDHSRQASPNYLADLAIKNRHSTTVMDLGCGVGATGDYFRRLNPNLVWIGLDLESSPEVSARNKMDNFVSYDGVRIPFKDNSIDLIFCHQVFEHVEKPHLLIREISRVLKPGGVFVGSVSHLEPFHSLSVFNYTPYGFNLLLKDASLSLIEVRPGRDIATLMAYRFTNKIPIINPILKRFDEHESPFNMVLGLLGKLTRKSHQDINLLKLLFCAQFRFLAVKE
jgi:SAM-dependent methyltransferase